MHKSKSCEDLHINIRYSSDATDVNSNVIVTNLMKTGPSRKIYDQDQPDAYVLANAQKRKSMGDCKMIKCYDPSPQAGVYRMRQCLSQEEIEKLINIQDELKLLAYQTICSRVPLKSRTPLRITAKQLTQTDMRSLTGRMKRSELVKKVMANATQNIKKNKKQKKNNGLTLSSSQSIQSISSRTFETFKSSFRQQTRQQKAMKAEKVNHFHKINQKRGYQQIYNTERRKQAWNAYLQAERNKVIMSRPGQHNTYVTFVNIGTNKMKKINKNCKKVQQRDDDDKYIETLKAFKSFNQNFENFSANYKIKLR